MYFGDKFNEEVQLLARHQKKGGSTRLGKYNGAFYKIAPVNPNNKKERPPYIKVIPLLMFDKISSSNSNDTSFEHKCIICENNPSTIIRCW